MSVLCNRTLAAHIQGALCKHVMECFQEPDSCHSKQGPPTNKLLFLHFSVKTNSLIALNGAESGIGNSLVNSLSIFKKIFEVLSVKVYVHFEKRKEEMKEGRKCFI